MRADLHTHSTRSDGTDGPAELVRESATAGLDVLGLTDHDTVAGWAEAGAEADRQGLELVRGIEVSCQLRGRSVHLLGYRPDPADEELCAELARLRAGRSERVPAILERLARCEVRVELSDVCAQAPDAAALGRPHVADALVALGYAGSRGEAFDRWLSPGAPGFVTRYAPDPETAIRLLARAGGAPVLAHPRGRGSAAVMTDRQVGALAAAGLVGIEVDHPDHDAPTRAGLRRLAAELDLVVTGSSDYHGTGKVGHALGCCLTAPDQWARLERLMTRADPERPGRRTAAPGRPR